MALLVAFAIVACQNNTARQQTSLPATDCRIVQHAMGEVCVPKVPKRLVSLDEITLADALILGVPSVGVSSYDKLADYLVEKSEDIEFLGTSEAPSLEKIYQLNPDLILGTELSVESIYPQLSQIAPTALGKWSGYPDWRKYFDFVAGVLDKEDRAKEVWSDYHSRVEEFKATLGDRLKNTKVSLAYACCGNLTMDTENSFAGSILADIGIPRPKSQVVGNGTIPLSEERLGELDGDILFLSVYDEDSEKTLADWQQKPLWNQLQVVQNKRVYLVPGRIWRAGDLLAANLILDDLYKYLIESS